MEDKKEFMKFDDDKPEWDLLPLSPLEGVVRVLMYGMKKGYPRHNWKKGLNKAEVKCRVYNAMMRHLIQWKEAVIDKSPYASEYDMESTLNHLWHFMCNAVFLSYFDRYEDKGGNDETS